MRQGLGTSSFLGGDPRNVRCDGAGRRDREGEEANILLWGNLQGRETVEHSSGLSHPEET